MRRIKTRSAATAYLKVNATGHTLEQSERGAGAVTPAEAVRVLGMDDWAWQKALTHSRGSDPFPMQDELE
jgi:hypothetical protein